MTIALHARVTTASTPSSKKVVAHLAQLHADVHGCMVLPDAPCCMSMSSTFFS
jgi:hypothetical protein